MKLCWKQDPKDRPNFEQICEMLDSGYEEFEDPKETTYTPAFPGTSTSASSSPGNSAGKLLKKNKKSTSIDSNNTNTSNNNSAGALAAALGANSGSGELSAPYKTIPEMDRNDPETYASMPVKSDHEEESETGSDSSSDTDSDSSDTTENNDTTREYKFTPQASIESQHN